MEATKRTVLFAALDWGLGHATRSASLIRAAVDDGHRVHVASSGPALAWLRAHFAEDGVTFHEKPGRAIRYARVGTGVRIALQMPGFLRSIGEERRWTEGCVRRHGVDRVFSDNCYGVAAEGVPSVLMTHQVHLPVPGVLRARARAFVRGQAARFREVWVPDGEGERGEGRLSGRLGGPALHPRTRFIGGLSHLPADGGTRSEWAIGGVVSGPEPLRSALEAAYRERFAGALRAGERALIVAGRPGGGVREDGAVTTWYSPDSAALAGALQGAGRVVCRSGYSTLLDLAQIRVRAHLIPTPGQPEQELLAAHFARAFGWSTSSQRAFAAGAPFPTTGQPLHLPANTEALAALRAWLAEE